MNYISLIESALTFPDNSKLSSEALLVPGFTSNKVRHFLNNLCSSPDIIYLEIGTHKGATLISACYGNKHNRFIGIDNFCEFDDLKEAQGYLMQNLSKFSNQASPEFIAGDCWDYETISKVPDNINIYFYDGAHDIESQKKAITVYYPKLADTFVLIVDDWNWDNSRTGTYEGISEMELNIVYSKDIFTPGRQSMHEHFWNGLGIFVLEKEVKKNGT